MDAASTNVLGLDLGALGIVPLDLEIDRASGEICRILLVRDGRAEHSPELEILLDQLGFDLEASVGRALIKQHRPSRRSGRAQ